MDQQTNSSNVSSSQTTPTTSSGASDNTPSSSAAPSGSDVATQASSAPVIPSTESSQAPSEPAPYQPNYKFKANDEEHEIDEEYRAYIKSAEDEKRIKRMFEQFKGVDKLKETWKSTSKEAREYRQKVENYENSISAFNKLVQSGKEFEAFKLLGVSDKMLYQAAKQAMEFDELPQQARDIYNQSQEQTRLAQQIFQQNQFYQEQMAEMRTNSRRAELDQTLAHPEIKDVVSRYDAIHGDGSFKQDVIAEAQAEYLRTQQTSGQGVDLTAADAVNRVLRKIKPFMSAPQPQPINNREVPVIPSTSSGSRSSVSSGPQIRSIKDLEKEYEKKLNAMNR